MPSLKVVQGITEPMIQVRFRLPMDDWDRVRKQADPSDIERWLRQAVRKQLDVAEKR